ncbi:class I SAM-dependent methyltransferase [Vibrio panuliri]|nr:class I SAM-dependent methyltransferase [Vibrio panuliri]
MVKYDSENFDPESLSSNDIDYIQLKMIAGNSRVLEIGCATGFMSDYLRKEKNCFVYGVEYSKTQAEVAQSKCDVLTQGSIEDSNVHKEIDEHVKLYGKFDVIFISQVIEHLVSPNNILEKMKDWLDVDGSLIISTVNVAHWESRIRLLKGVWEYSDYGLFDNTHLRFYTVNSLEKDLIRSGYIIEDSGYNVVDFPPLFMIPVLNKITFIKVLDKLGIKNSKAKNWYINKFRNLLAFQFVFKVKLRSSSKV